MSVLPVSPTRMELSRLKKQLELSVRGHKLLKDKQDELMRQFIGIVKETERLRTEIEEKYRVVRRRALLAAADYSQKELMESAVTDGEGLCVSVKTKNQMGVIVPVMEFDRGKAQNGEFLSLSPALSQTKGEMEGLLPVFLKLAQQEKHCVILAAEIEKTRRRVNALEYMTIPQLKETIRFIKMRLGDNERDQITRLIKIQDFGLTAEM